MKSHGNTLMNKIFNPKNIKPPVPTDIDEEDACMEKFIRQKYQHRSLEDGKPKPPSRHDSGYTRSPEGSPPPLPPKTGKFFGFGLRSASSTSNLRRFSTSKPSSPRRNESPPPPLPLRTATQDIDAGDLGATSFESKLAALKEMGFPDERRNTTILRGLNGNMDKTIDSLTRLGEGTRPISRARTPMPTSSSVAAPASPPRATTSYNPFDQLDPKPANQPSGQSYNPFDMPNSQPASAQPLDVSFQNLQVSQPLFPHSTGGYPNRPTGLSQSLYQQSATPPVTATFSQTFSQNGPVSSAQTFDGGNNPFFQSSPQPQINSAGPFTSQFPPNGTQTNPFFNQLSPQHTSMQPQTQSLGTTSVPTLAPPPQPRQANTMAATSSTSPFGPVPPFQQPQPQPQPQTQLQPPQLTPQLQPQSTGLGQQSPSLNPYNPFQSMTAPSTPQNAGFQNQLQPQAQQPQLQQPGFQSAPQQLMPQATGRVDKNSILSLYSLSSPAPSMPQQPSQLQQPSMTTSSSVPGLAPSLGSAPQTQPGATQQSSLPQPPLSAGAVPSASRNPFMSATAPGAPPQPDFTQQPFQSQPQPQPQPQPQLQFQQQQQQQPQLQQPPSTQPGMGMGMGMGINGAPHSANAGFARTHMSQPSVDISGLHNGRHSPDAFASLSARYG